MAHTFTTVRLRGSGRAKERERHHSRVVRLEARCVACGKTFSYRSDEAAYFDIESHLKDKLHLLRYMYSKSYSTETKSQQRVGLVPLCKECRSRLIYGWTPRCDALLRKYRKLASKAKNDPKLLRERD